jgi:hypothetical protein
MSSGCRCHASGSKFCYAIYSGHQQQGRQHSYAVSRSSHRDTLCLTLLIALLPQDIAVSRSLVPCTTGTRRHQSQGMSQHKLIGLFPMGMAGG